MALGITSWGPRKPPPGSRINPGDPINRDLVSLWMFNEGAQFRVEDVVSNNHATLGPVLTWQSGKFGAAVQFFGSAASSSVNCTAPSNASLDITGSFTITSWARGQARTNSAIGGRWNGSGYMLYLDASNKLRVYCDGTFTTGATTVFAADGDWLFVAGVFNAATQRATIYINGQVDVDASNAKSSIATAALPYEMGNYNGSAASCWGVIGGSGQASLDNQRLYRRALSNNEINRLYKEPFAGLMQNRRLFIPVTATAPSSFIPAWAKASTSIIGSNINVA